MTRDELFAESGKRGEEQVENELEKICAGKYIHNLLLRYDGFISEICSVEMDYICILKKYIYIIEVKNWNSITKYDFKKDEYHILINKKSRHKKSPIYQNAMHREMLSQLLNISEKRIICMSVICTDDDSDDKYVRDRNPQKYVKSHVIRLEELKGKIKEYEGIEEKELDDVENIWSNIERANWSTEEIYSIEHKIYCKKVEKFLKQGLVFPKFLQCDECGGTIVLGEKNGEYFGKCKNFPKRCKRKTIPQKDFEQYIVQEWFKEGRIVYKMSIAEYENKIREKRKELERMEKCIQEITMKPEYIRNKEFEEIKENNIILKNKVSNLQEKQKEQEENIKKLMLSEESMKNELCILRKEKEKVVDKYQKTLRYKIERISGR